MTSSALVSTDSPPTTDARAESADSGRDKSAFPVRDHPLPLFAESRDAKAHFLALPQVHRRLHAVADAGRRARRDDVARAQAHEPAQVADEERDVEHHRARVPGLI